MSLLPLTRLGIATRMCVSLLDRLRFEAEGGVASARSPSPAGDRSDAAAFDARGREERNAPSR